MKNLRFILLIFVLVTSACLPDSNTKTIIENNDVVEGTLGTKKFKIPKVYFKSNSDFFTQDNVSIQTMYPDFKPLQKHPDTYWKEGEWWKNIRFIIKYHPNTKLDNEGFAQHKISTLNATEVVGQEYGLRHQTQPEDGIADKRDVWLDDKNGQVQSVITCSEKLIEKDFPNCKQFFYLPGKLLVSITYDKKLLKHWKEIEENVRNLITRFSAD